MSQNIFSADLSYFVLTSSQDPPVKIFQLHFLYLLSISTLKSLFILIFFICMPKKC